ncbi:MAG: crp 2 [Steroidobacteraceae bacterium]|nr:crp 2 [Steroidobacteraceae bacterium]MBM2853095.1 crp 2 [Steroidobacteraceae bacterium]
MLQRSPLFRGLTPPALERIAELAGQRSFRAGEIVFSQGDPGDALYAVVTGKIRISAGAADGREMFLNIMEPGDTFGEIALLDGGTRTASATATLPSELVTIRREHFLGLLEREPRVALELLHLCGERLRWTSGLVEDAALLKAPARLAKRLLSLGRLHGEPSARGVTLRISQEDLASFLGVSRQVVNQNLQGWKGRGWVELGRGTVTVRDEAAIKKTAQEH